jgi:nickel-dependent lactate racemase
VLVNSAQQIVAMYSGDFRKEHRAGLEMARHIWMTRLDPVDVAVYSPGDGRERYLESSFFITLDSAYLATKPDGVIILVASMAGGYAPAGGGLPFSDRMSTHELFELPSPDIARALIDSTGNIRTASMIFAAKRVLEQRTVVLVAEGIERAEARRLGFGASFRTFDDALAFATSVKGPAATMATCFPRGIQWRIMPWREG